MDQRRHSIPGNGTGDSVFIRFRDSIWHADKSPTETTSTVMVIYNLDGVAFYSRARRSSKSRACRAVQSATCVGRPRTAGDRVKAL